MRRPTYDSSWFVPALLLGLLAATSVVPSTAPATLTWRLLPNAPLRPPGGRHEDVFFLDRNLGWVVNLQGQIFKTTDGGDTWVTQVDTTEAFRSVAFASPQHGWVGSVFDINLLFETVDGGETWHAVEGIPEPRPAGICGLWVASPDVIYGCGKYSGPARMIKSEDGGSTWSSIDLSPWADTLVDCAFVSPDSGFVVGGIGTFPDQTRTVVLSTGDGGATWSTRFTGTTLGEWAWKISLPQDLVGYVSLERYSTSSGQFLKTLDGGTTWISRFFPDGRAQGVGFVSDTHGWIGGPPGRTYQTTTGGQSWSDAGFGNDINRFVLLTENLGYAVGRGVYKYSDDAVTAVGGEPPVAPAPASLEQNFPNPFNPTTVIRYYLDEATHVRLIVCDPSGAEVKTLVDALRPFGEHEIVWDGTDRLGRRVASGLYFYRLESEDYAEVRKMTLLR